MPSTCSYRWRQVLDPQKNRCLELKRNKWGLKKKPQHIFQCKTVWTQKTKEEIPTVLIFVSDKNTLTGEALEMWDAMWGGKIRAVGNVFQTWWEFLLREVLQEKNNKETNKRKTGQPRTPCFTSVWPSSVPYTSMFCTHTICILWKHFILTAVYSSVC